MKHLKLVLACVLLFVHGCTDKPESPGSGGNNNAQSMNHDLSLSGSFKGPLGLQLWSVRDYTKDDVRGTLDKVRSMGFRNVELAGTYGLSPAEFRSMLAENDLTATAMHAPYDRFRDSTDVVVSEAKTLGVEYVGVAWIPHDGDAPLSVETVQTAAAYFNKWGATARDSGIRFFYHVHGYEFQAGPDGKTAFDLLAALTDPELVSFEMDVFWVTLPGVDPSELLRRYPDRWKLMHIKDMRKGTTLGVHTGSAPAEDDVPIGTGLIDYEEVLRTAAKVGVEQYYIEDESPQPLQNIPRSVSFLESIRF